MKEIIIDGVDVAGCRNYKHNAENIGWSKCLSKDEEHYHFNNPLCCEMKDCYYKQLKRAEIEIEKLKGVDGSVHPDSAYYKIARLEQENAELKAENERLKSENETYDREQYYYYNLSEEYKQTLQEIKNFLELPEFYLYGKETIHDRILQKITKAEVGE